MRREESGPLRDVNKSQISFRLDHWDGTGSVQRVQSGDGTFGSPVVGLSCQVYPTLLVSSWTSKLVSRRGRQT